jgi:hypothetical protein
MYKKEEFFYIEVTGKEYKKVHYLHVIPAEGYCVEDSKEKTYSSSLLQFNTKEQAQHTIDGLIGGWKTLSYRIMKCTRVTMTKLEVA